MSKSFQHIEFEQIPRGDNSRADALASYGSAVKDQGNRYILHEHIEKSAISEEAEAEVLPVSDDIGGWTRPIEEYLLHGSYRQIKFKPER